MRIPSLLLGLSFALFASLPPLAGAAGFRLTSVPTPSGPAMSMAVWYPSASAPRDVSFGPMVLRVALNAAPTAGAHPLVLISHGTGGSELSHLDTAIALADAGFVVAAIAHPGDNYRDDSRAVEIQNRPRHISRAIDFLLDSPDWRALVDAQRIGIFGFSAGGFTALAAVGGIADLGRIAPHCREHAGDFPCRLLARQPAGSAMPIFPPDGVKDARIRAAVVAAPALGFTFSKEGLQDVRLPLQLWRAENDEILPHPFYAEAVRVALPLAPEFHLVENAGHFDFLAPCTADFAAMAVDLCRSRAGFDRAAFHAQFNRAVTAFFLRTLAP